MRPDDVTANHYVADSEKWRQERGPIPEDLKTIIRRTAKEIAHLTTKRHSAGSPAKAWNPEPLYRAFCAPLRTLAEHVPARRLDGGVRFFIAQLPQPPVA